MSTAIAPICVDIRWDVGRAVLLLYSIEAAKTTGVQSIADKVQCSIVSNLLTYLLL